MSNWFFVIVRINAITNILNISSDVATRKNWKILSDANVFSEPNEMPISGTGIGDKILKFTRLDDSMITSEL